MRFEDVEYAIAIARVGGVARAAMQLGISQPAMSKALARLEAELKTRLFERKARGVQLTEEGRLFLEHASRAVMHASDARTALRDLRQGHSGQVRLGVGIGVPAEWVAKACLGLLERGNVRFDLRSGHTDSLLTALRGGELDLIIGGIPRQHAEDLVWSPLWPDPMLPFVPRSHAMARTPKRWTLENFARERWLLPPRGTVARGAFDSAFITAGLQPPVPLIESRATGKDGEYALALGAVALMPQSMATYGAKAADFLCVTSIPALCLARTVSLLRRSAAYLSPAAQRFIAIIDASANPRSRNSGRRSAARPK